MTKTLKDIVYEQILPRVIRPGQYAGGERNSVVKDHASVDIKVALAFPDTYEIGMSHLGLKILYHILNERENVVAERVFAPWTDMEHALRERGLPLHTLETFTPLSDFDIVGFSLQYELSYTNVLNMLELAGIPRLTADRSPGDPVVLGGGSIAAAAEPVAPFFDAILVGDAEDVILRIIDAVRDWRNAGARARHELHGALSLIPGVYVPSLYDITYNADGTISRIGNIPPAPERVEKTTVEDLENAPFPITPIVPNVSVVHDRINIEIMRGCPNQCRFCQAVYHYRPIRKRSAAKIIELAEAVYRQTGYEEISLSSLSSADYPGLFDLLHAIAERFDSRYVNMTLPSLRVGPQLERLPELTSKVRKGGLTMAPEVATDRLRDVIGKSISNDDLLAGCRAAYAAGYRQLKFYFLIGVPTERDEDLRGIVDLCNEASLLRKSVRGAKGGRARINASVSSFIPKPHTPFQWEAMESRESLRSRQKFIRDRCSSGAIRFKFHHVDMSYLEAVFSRGDRRLSGALLKAREAGLRMDGWSECFDIQAWEDVFRDVGADPSWYALRARTPGELLPWDTIGLKIPPSHLAKEKLRAYDL